MSCHKLEIEIGRYKKIPAESRFCQKCKSGKVEDEIHFITECHVLQMKETGFSIIYIKSVKMQFVKSPEVYMAFQL